MHNKASRNPASSFPAETCMDVRNFGHAWCHCTPIQPSAFIDPGEREGGWGGGGVTRIPDMQLAFVVAGFYRFSWHLVFIMSGLLHGDVFLTSWRLKQPREIIESDHKPRVIAFSNWSSGIIHKEIQKKCMFSRVSGNQIKNCFLHLYMNVSSKILLLTCKEKCIRVSRCLILQWDNPSNFLKLDFISYFQP